MEPRHRSLVTALGLATLVAAAVLANAGVALLNLARIREAQAWVTHTHLVLESLDLLLSSLQDAESGQRGFLISGEPRYLEACRAGVASAESGLSKLGLLTRDNLRQQQALERLRPVVRAKLQALKGTVELRQAAGSAGFEPARRVVLEEDGRRLMNDVRGQIAAMVRHEEMLLGERSRSAAAAANTARNTTILGFAVSLLLLAASVEVFRRRVREREGAAAVLAAEKERFRTTLASLGDAVIVTDVDGRITMMNPSAEGVLGWDGSAVGKPLLDVFRILNEQTRKPAEDPVTTVLATGQVVGLANHTIAIRRDGREVAIDDSAAPIRDEHGTTVGVVLVFRDITGRRKIERELQQKHELLVVQDRRKNEFLAVLSHELRNPLAPIRNAITILKRAEAAGDQASRARDILDRQVAQLSRLVDDLLDVSRISEGKLRLARAPVRLTEAVRRTVDDHLALFQAQRIQVALHTAEDVWVEGDASRLIQVVGNLLQNAAKFTPAGGHVDVKLTVEHGRAVLSVRDDGVGMDPAMLAKLFQPFSQSERTLARTKGGLGLGLALARTLVELHGGTVDASSAGVGRGTEFVVKLPLGRNVPVSSEAGSAPAPREPLRILIVEDNPDGAAMLRELLQLDGHVVSVATNGLEGVDAALAQQPDLVLCDLGLPGVDGFEVARRLRAAGSRARLVAVTGYAREEDAEQARAAGFDDHLAKPVHPGRLATVLESTQRSPERLRS